VRLPTDEERDGLELLQSRFPDGSLLTEQECAALEWIDAARRPLSPMALEGLRLILAAGRGGLIRAERRSWPAVREALKWLEGVLS
jgi:hypothetical protein